MKKIIQIAVSETTVTVNRIEKEIDLPETSKYYQWYDDGRFFPRGIVLFAILPYFEGKAGSYSLLEVERNKQDYNDFVPHDDCSRDYWRKTEGIRKTAFDILTGKNQDFKEITKEEFDSKRMELLNNYQE